MLVLVSVVFTCGTLAIAQGFPSKPITFVIPYPAGGSTDLTGRVLANAAKGYLGQPIICENKSGGGGTVGPSLVISKPPDGYTIGISSGAVTIAYHMGKLNFNPITDTTPIIRYTSYVFGLVVRADAPWKTIQELVKYAKENPQKVTYGTPGVGTNPHLAMEELSIITGIQLVHMPFKGGAEANTALLGGHIDAISDSTSWGPLVDAGKFRLLVTYAPQRMPRYPNVPTLKEAGYNMVYSSPIFIIGP
jgi:tripartite-type tricarboxylate transporter receptor subunit TctC